MLNGKSGGCRGSVRRANMAGAEDAAAENGGERVSGVIKTVMVVIGKRLFHSNA